MIPLTSETDNSLLSTKEQIDKLLTRIALLKFNNKEVPPGLQRKLDALMAKMTKAADKANKPANKPKDVRRARPPKSGEEDPAPITSDRDTTDEDSTLDANEKGQQAGTNNDPDAGSVPKPPPTFQIDEVMVALGIVAVGLLVYLNWGK
jgi:hypothetical protein